MHVVMPDYIYNGKRIRKITGTSNKEEAEKNQKIWEGDNIK